MDRFILGPGDGEGNPFDDRLAAGYPTGPGQEPQEYDDDPDDEDEDDDEDNDEEDDENVPEEVRRARGQYQRLAKDADPGVGDILDEARHGVTRYSGGVVLQTLIWHAGRYCGGDGVVDMAVTDLAHIFKMSEADVFTILTDLAEMGLVELSVRDSRAALRIVAGVVGQRVARAQAHLCRKEARRSAAEAAEWDDIAAWWAEKEDGTTPPEN